MARVESGTDAQDSSGSGRVGLHRTRVVAPREDGQPTVERRDTLVPLNEFDQSFDDRFEVSNPLQALQT